MSKSENKRPPLTPRYWAGWLGVSVLWILGKTPQWLGLALSRPLAWILPRLMKSRHQIAQHNVERCFPEKTELQRKAIVKECFHSLARAVFEICWSWSASDKAILRMSDIQGAEHAVAAWEQGKGVLMVSAHVSCLEIGARILGARFHQGKGMYRPLKSPVLEWYQTRARSRYTDGTIRKRDLRSAIRYIKKGGVLWYAPDQDFGPRQSIFVPFFGIPTATLLATHRIPAITDCAVVPMFPSYDSKTRRYTVEILPALTDYPSTDPEADLARVTAVMERHIREHPGQYWWIHRRFKTRPEGEPPFYD
jgi:KDO2-lipid IV(A) lauroyltransferase